ncbi:MAG: signal peptidase I [Gammaproteobacteria bacterium]|nr:signal peptidase I [Gammaproteobacteria bacterium]
MNIDFPFILTMLVVITGLIALADTLFFAKRRTNEAAMPKIIEFSKSFFPALLLVWIIRSFIIQPYRVPTGSLEPTVLPGDFIAVKQFSYGLRVPVINQKIFGVGEPKRGDIALFHWPVDTSKLFVKRVIGLPGDHIVYKNKTLTINGQEMSQEYLGKGKDIEQDGLTSEVDHKIENLAGIKHNIFVKPEVSDPVDVDIVVPDNHYFMMGDNRDDSDDSRSWGFVPETFLIGKAFGIWMSWDAQDHHVRWNRIGKAVK